MAGGGIHGDGARVKRIEENTALRENRAAIDDIAAGDTLRSRRDSRLIFPFDGRPRLGQIESK